MKKERLTDIVPLIPELYSNKFNYFHEHTIPDGKNFIDCAKDFCPFCKLERDILNNAMTEYFKKRLRDDYSK